MSLVYLLTPVIPLIKFLLLPVEPFVHSLFTIIGLGLVLLWPLIKYIGYKNAEYLITDQRVFIKPNTQSQSPRIINLYEVNGKVRLDIGFIEKYFGTGSIYIPNPRPYDIATPATPQGNVLLIVSADIKAIKEAERVHRIIQEAIETGKRTNWK